MKSIIAAFVLIPQLLLAQAVPGLLGQWKSEEVLYGRNVQFQVGFDFSATNAKINVNCLFTNGAKLFASAESSATYNVNEIFVNETKQTVTDDGIRFCRASISPGKWTAYFNGAGKMVLFVPAPYQAQFNLIPVLPN